MLGPKSQATCSCCPAAQSDPQLVKLGLKTAAWDHVVALAGNPNTGKSTVFNNLTGLRQHTGNWPGKTVDRAEGGFYLAGKRYKVVDLPGTYSLMSASTDEVIARDFILFGRPDVTAIVVDANRLERNLNLVLQILAITDRALVCLNLMDEASRHHLQVDTAALARDLGVPVVPTSARSGQGMSQLTQGLAAAATAKRGCARRCLVPLPANLERVVDQVAAKVESVFPKITNKRWVSLRLLQGDERIESAVATGALGRLDGAPATAAPDPAAGQQLLAQAKALRWEIDDQFHDSLMEGIYTDAARIAARTLSRDQDKSGFDLGRRVDSMVTSRRWGFPLMLLLLAGVMWLTITGANYPSRLLFALLIETIYPTLKVLAANANFPWWLDGVLIDGTYLALGWVVSVMLPPMAIFFPLFTLLEDLGYLPRVAFNLDHLFKKVGAHGKQALTMCMGFGCNAAGVVAARIIESPRERLLAIVTNNFALCNGRWPTQILIATIFIGNLATSHLASLFAAAAVVAVTLLGIAFSFVVSWALSRTALRGEVSHFSLELPPYRPPRLWRTLYTSLIDRTLFVLWRAMVFAAPAGAVIWLVANIPLGDQSLAEYLVGLLDPFGLLLGLNGVILLAYLVAVPANEIVIPTVLMLTVLNTGLAGVGEGAGVVFELDSATATAALLQAGDWTLLTGINLMLFSLLHNPCSTTLYTIWKETRSVKWTWIAALLPLALGLITCFGVAQIWHIAAG